MTTFIFGGKYQRRPLSLAKWPGYINPDIRERIKKALENGCGCNHDIDRTASLTIRGGSVWLQCDQCGASLGNAMSKRDHQAHASYRAWNSDIAKKYEDAHDEYMASIPRPEDLQAERKKAYLARSAAYEEWCRSSPEWSDIVKKVAWRSRGHCEACLNAPSEVVHHLTYEFGKLPPAWHLKAICHPCHNRLHCAGDDWCGYGMAR